MKLYLKFNQRSKILKPRINGKVDYSKQYELRPYDATEVPDTIAKILIEQNPDAVSTTPFDPSQIGRIDIDTISPMEVERAYAIVRAHKEKYGPKPIPDQQTVEEIPQEKKGSLQQPQKHKVAKAK